MKRPAMRSEAAAGAGTAGRRGCGRLRLWLRLSLRREAWFFSMGSAGGCSGRLMARRLRRASVGRGRGRDALCSAARGLRGQAFGTPQATSGREGCACGVRCGLPWRRDGRGRSRGFLCRRGQGACAKAVFAAKLEAVQRQTGRFPTPRCGRQVTRSGGRVAMCWL